MAQLKISELFYSIQGEGRYMGVPSVFLRTYGCNFTCGGFGMPKGEMSSERDTIAIKAEDFTEYKSLPLVSTGCDSYASWDPRFKHLSPVLTTDSIVDSIMDILPHKRWMDEHLVITGGEPLLGWQRAYPELLSNEKMKFLKEITFETNGTQLLEPELVNFLNEWKKHRFLNCLTFSVSPKLSISGESWEEAICPDVIQQYYNIGYTYLKSQGKYAVEFIDISDPKNLPSSYTPLQSDNELLINPSIKAVLAVAALQKNSIVGLLAIDTDEIADLPMMNDKNLHSDIFDWIVDNSSVVELFWRMKNNV
jgi:organic radical activating enzyme